MAYDIMLSNKTGGWRYAGAAVAQIFAGHGSIGGEQLSSFATFVVLEYCFPFSLCCVFILKLCFVLFCSIINLSLL